MAPRSKKAARKGKKGGSNHQDLDVRGSNQLVPYDPKILWTDKMRLTTPVAAHVRIWRSYVDTGIVQSSTVVTYTARAFTVGAISDWGSLAAVFDQYRILAVEVLYQPRSQEAIVNSTTANLGHFYTVIDYDDATVLTSVGAATNYENVIVGTNTQAQRRCFKPRIAVAANGGGLFTSYANMAAQWIDAASSTVSHYGTKEVLEMGNTGALATFDVFVHMDLELRASR
jgi:hypothetical protein